MSDRPECSHSCFFPTHDRRDTVRTGRSFVAHGGREVRRSHQLLQDRARRRQKRRLRAITRLGSMVCLLMTQFVLALGGLATMSKGQADVEIAIVSQPGPSPRVRRWFLRSRTIRYLIDKPRPVPCPLRRRVEERFEAISSTFRGLPQSVVGELSCGLTVACSEFDVSLLPPDRDCPSMVQQFSTTCLISWRIDRAGRHQGPYLNSTFFSLYVAQ